MSSRIWYLIMSKINDDITMLSEISKYFKEEYQRMLKEMTIYDIRVLWYLLNGRRK